MGLFKMNPLPFKRTQNIRYYGTVSLSNFMAYMAATSVGDYALFGGGSKYTNETGTSSENSNIVYAYNKALTRTTPTTLRSNFYHSATTVGDYAIFVPAASSKSVSAYNTSLTRSSPADIVQGRYNITATSVGNYALFGGGRQSGYSSIHYSDIDIYNSSLTKSTANFSYVVATAAATSVGDYALFGGGEGDSSGSAIKYVTVFDTSLTMTSGTSLTYSALGLAATSVGDYALFGGGTNSSYDSGRRSNVYAFNSSLIMSNITSLSAARAGLVATTVGDNALFGGGDGATYQNYSNSKVYANVDVYNSSLSKSVANNLSAARAYMSATSIGHFALFAGGVDISLSTRKNYKTVDVYASY